MKIDLQCSPQLILKTIEDALLQAGALLAQDQLREEGPRGAWSKAPADTEAERVMRDIIEANFPSHRIMGEEIEDDEALYRPSPFMWLLDPNDGTTSYIKGYRGSASSIGLIYEGQPIAGGVYAYTYPNNSGDLIMGGLPELFGGVTRNGLKCPVPQPKARAASIIGISQGADGSSEANIAQLAPSRYLAIPSISYRLALAAVDDVQAGISVHHPDSYELAGGHALLKAQGRELFVAPGVPYTYNDGGHGPSSSQFAGGDPELCGELLQLNLKGPVYQSDRAEELYPLCGPIKAKSALSRGAQLSRAQGALMGMMCGDALGSLVEFQSASAIRSAHPEGVKEMRDGGTFDKLAGQVTDDSEMAIALARSILKAGSYEQSAALEAYASWLQSSPFDVGITTRSALGPASRALRSGAELELALSEARRGASQESQANGALMRVTPLALYAAGRGLSDDEAAALARLDAQLTHPHQVCQDANAVFVVALKAAITEDLKGEALYERVMGWAHGAALEESVMERLQLAKREAPTEGRGWVLVGLQAAFYALLHKPQAAEAISWAISLGHDTDTNAAITGALVGAAGGLEALPRDWKMAVISSRPSRSLGRGRCVRPKWLWSCDALSLAEQLVQGSGPQVA